MTDSVDPKQDDPSGLSAAPDHIKLAVDLIVLLEENQVDTNTALLALDIVKTDLLNKHAQN